MNRDVGRLGAGLLESCAIRHPSGYTSSSDDQNDRRQRSKRSKTHALPGSNRKRPGFHPVRKASLDRQPKGKNLLYFIFFWDWGSFSFSGQPQGHPGPLPTNLLKWPSGAALMIFLAARVPDNTANRRLPHFRNQQVRIYDHSQGNLTPLAISSHRYANHRTSIISTTLRNALGSMS